MNTPIRIQRFLSRLATAALSALVLLALAAPAGAQASRTRPPSGGSSAGSSSGSGGSGGSSGGSVSVGGSASSHRSGSPSAVGRTRPPQRGSSSPTVIERDRRPGGGSYHRYPYRDHPYRYYDPFYFGFSFGYPYWGSPYWSPYWTWGPYYGGYWWDYGHRYPHAYAGVNVYPSQLSPSMGALDLDVWPAKTEVYIDGQYVGVVDNFDGWPRYLWLEKGTYDVIFYKEGFATLARQYTVYPGVVIDVGDRMQPGESVRPEDLISKSTVRRDERIAQQREQEAAAARGAGEQGQWGDWKERVRGEREEMARRPPPAEVEAVESGRAVDARGEPGRVHVAVEPDDAAVYLDGRFMGTGRELSRLDSGLIVDPGAHKLSVVRPGRESKSVDFTVEAGKEVELTVALAAAG